MKTLKYIELSDEGKIMAQLRRAQDMIEFEMEDHYNNWPEFKKAIDLSNKIKDSFNEAYVMSFCETEIELYLSDKGSVFNPNGEIPYY